MGLFDHDPEPEIYYPQLNYYLEKENVELVKLLKPIIPIMEFIYKNTKDPGKQKRAKEWLEKVKEIL